MSQSLHEWVCTIDDDDLVSYHLDAYVSTEDDDVTAETETGMALLWKQTNKMEEGEDHDQKTEMMVPNLNKALAVFHAVNGFCGARSEETKITSTIGKIKDNLEKCGKNIRAEENNKFLRLHFRKSAMLLWYMYPVISVILINVTLKKYAHTFKVTIFCT
jgi:hypothetical protein